MWCLGTWLFIKVEKGDECTFREKMRWNRSTENDSNTSAWMRVGRRMRYSAPHTDVSTPEQTNSLGRHSRHGVPNVL